MKKNVAATVTELVADTVAANGCELWDVEYVKEGADRVLRLVIDSNEGVTLDDCERVSHAVDPLLDEADPIESFYYLEVSSPGIERELKTDRHLAASVGTLCEARLFAPLNGTKSVTNLYVSVAGEGVMEPVEDAAEKSRVLLAMANAFSDDPVESVPDAVMEMTAVWKLVLHGVTGKSNPPLTPQE